MPRGKQREPTWVHINIRVPQGVYEYFSQSPNMSEAIREVLSAYVNTPNNVRGPTQQEVEDGDDT
jgi:hypothetical protein